MNSIEKHLEEHQLELARMVELLVFEQLSHPLLQGVALVSVAESEEQRYGGERGDDIAEGGAKVSLCEPLFRVVCI